MGKFGDFLSVFVQLQISWNAKKYRPREPIGHYLREAQAKDARTSKYLEWRKVIIDIG